MKTLRAKLFVSIGAILLIVAFLNYAIPSYYLSKDVTKVSSVLHQTFDQERDNVYTTLALLLSGYYIDQAAATLSLSKMIEQGVLSFHGDTPEKQAAELISLHPSLAYVEVEDKSGKKATIIPENGMLYTPQWAYKGSHLFIKFCAQTYLAKQIKPNIYALYPTAEDAELSYTPFEKPEPKGIYQTLNQKNELELMRAGLITTLISEKDRPPAILQVSPDFKQGWALLSDAVFQKRSYTSANASFFLFREGPPSYIDIGHRIETADAKITFALPLSTLTQELVNLLKIPIVLSSATFPAQTFWPQSHPQVPSDKEHIAVYCFEIGPLNVALLATVEKATLITRIMDQLKAGLTHKISLTLLSASFLIMLLGLLALLRVSKKITSPITQLAYASEEIGRGKFEGVTLPMSEGRKDEVGVLTRSFGKMVLALQDREKIRGVLNKVVSKEIATQILNSSVELGGEERAVSLLFSDIRNFTHLSNTMHPKEIVEMLNGYMTAMCEVIDATNGVVDKFVGDEIVALYGAPLTLEKHAEKAVSAAFAMMNRLQQWNEERRLQGVCELAIGIGIHTGIVCAGNMGANSRLNYTVIGANVNLAARLCAAAGPMQILISQDTYHALNIKERTLFTPHPPLTLKGFDEPVEVFQASRMPRTNLGS